MRDLNIAPGVEGTEDYRITQKARRRKMSGSYSSTTMEDVKEFERRSEQTLLELKDLLAKKDYAGARRKAACLGLIIKRSQLPQRKH